MTDSADASVGSRDPQLDELAREIALRRQAEEKLQQALARQRSLEEALRNSEDRFARFMQHFPGLAWIKDEAGRYVYANDAAVQAFQCEREALYGKTDDEIFPSETAAQFKENDLRARASAAGVRVTETLMQKDGELHYSVVSKFPIPGPDAAPDMVGGMAVDVTERRRAEQDAQFLAAASAALADVADYESTLQTVAQLAVPSFADWCAVYLLDADGSLRQLAVAHIGPDKVTLAGDLQHRRPPEPAAARGAWKIVRTGRSDIVPDVSNEPAALESLDATQLSLIRELGLRSYLGAPLSVRGKTFGAMTFFSSESARRYGPEDLAMARDLAHRAAIAIENARLYQALKDADRRKDEFLALLGHELRNPLAPICNSLQVLRLPGADAAITERAREMIERQIEQMVRLVDDLLDVSRIMRGQVELRREPIELATVIARAVETSQPCIDAERHRLTVGMPPDPLWLHGDLVRLAQVVSNLLNNAAKYTERGGEIGLEAAREQDKAVVRVRDNGIGIAAETLPRLFDMFYQAERRTRHSQGGLGIGLSLVRRLVELHGG
ncbi:MAG TPA: PAS domain-containing sensor histidine kinase, partial [Pirellulales bacterium]|nr:PAS domain-containing sensor histidine kinase [Pirellulales bacterium]